jgi:hypothetical protein
MLSVSFSLALVAAMLFGIVLPGHHKEVDKFNGQTRGPFPAGNNDLVSECRQFKVAKKQFCQSALVSAVGKPGKLPRRARGGDPVPQNGISSSRSTSSGFSFSADFGRLRKSTFSAMISQP